MVVVDRLIRGIGVDLAGAVAVDLRSDVAEKFGQLRFVVGAHAFARGTPLGFGGHDRDGTVYRPGRPQAGSPAGTRAARRSDLLLRTGGDAPAHVEIRSRNASRRGRPALIAIADFAPRRGGIRRLGAAPDRADMRVSGIRAAMCLAVLPMGRNRAGRLGARAARARRWPGTHRGAG